MAGFWILVGVVEAHAANAAVNTITETFSERRVHIEKPFDSLAFAPRVRACPWFSMGECAGGINRHDLRNLVGHRTTVKARTRKRRATGIRGSSEKRNERKAD